MPDQRRLQRIVPEPGHQRADEKRLHQSHLGVRRHLEPAQLQQAEPTAGGVRAVQLVDAEFGPVGIAGDVGEQVPQRAVDHPGRDGAVLPGLPADLGERDLHFVQRLGPALVGARRLRGRADELAGEQVRQRRMTLPMGQQRDQQIRPAQQRRLRRGDAADGDVVAAAGPPVAAVDGEGLGAEPALPGLLVQRGGDLDLLVPAGQRLDVDLDDARIRGHRQGLQPRVDRRAVALQHDRRTGHRRRVLDGRDQLDPRVELVERRQEDVQQAVANLGDQRGPRRAVRVDHDRAGLSGRRPTVGQHRLGGQRIGFGPPAPAAPRRSRPAASRRPAGESPVSSTIRPRRSRQSALPQPIVGAFFLAAGSPVECRCLVGRHRRPARPVGAAAARRRWPR